MNLTTTATPEETKNGRGIILSILIQGFLFLLPLMIILILLSVLFGFIFKVVAPLTALLDHGGGAPDWFLNLLSVSIVLVFVFLLGLLIKSAKGKDYFIGVEKIFNEDSALHPCSPNGVSIFRVGEIAFQRSGAY